MSGIPTGSRLKVFEVPIDGDDPNAAAFFVRRVDAERYGRHVNKDVREGYVTDQETIGYLLGPRHVPDALDWFLKNGIIGVADLSVEDAQALARAFGPKVS